MFTKSCLLFQNRFKKDVDATGCVEVTTEADIHGVDSVVVLVDLPNLCDRKQHDYSVRFDDLEIFNGVTTGSSIIATCPVRVTARRHRFTLTVSGVEAKSLDGRIALLDPARLWDGSTGIQSTSVHHYRGGSDDTGTIIFRPISFQLPGIRIVRATFKNENNCQATNKYLATATLTIDNHAYPIMKNKAAVGCIDFDADDYPDVVGTDFVVDLSMTNFTKRVDVGGWLILRYERR
jgi:hypothetical protein